MHKNSRGDTAGAWITSYSSGGFIHPSLAAAPVASSTNILTVRINKAGKKFRFISEQRFVGLIRELQ